MPVCTLSTPDSPADRAATAIKLAIHGPGVELHCEVDAVAHQIEQVLAPFVVSELPGGLGAIRGSIRPYDEAEVIRRLPLMARPLHRPGELTEIYSHEERFWTIDDRWGMCEINLLRGQWQSWVLKQPRLDAVRLFEGAVAWPLAQLLKNKGLHWVQAASVARGPFAMLMLSSFSLGPELAMLMAGGFKVIGQRWTLIRVEQDDIELLHVPGVVERQASAPFGQVASEWEDLAGDQDASQMRGNCNAVMVVDAARRPRAHLSLLEPANALNLLRRVWPIPELYPHRRNSHFPARLSQLCHCFQLQLSREPRDILMLFEGLQARARAG